jgi:hypothetical protein
MMNHKFSLRLIVSLVVLLVTAPAVTWRSSAALPDQDSMRGLLVEGDPDRIVTLAPQAPVPGGPGFQMVNAFQFRSAWQDRTWDYFNGELFNPGPVDNFYEAALSIPNKVTITGMVVYFYDNSTLDLLVGLWRTDPSTGNQLEMATVASSGAQDQYRNAADTSIIEPVVDQQSYSYVIEVGMYSGDNTLRLAAVRIDYGYGVNLPAVTNNP